MEYFLFFLGFLVLIFGADFLVEGASSLAKKLNLSDAVIGMTIVAFGTSAPELIVNVIASFQGKSQLAFGNIIGSNISNILLILGCTALFNEIRIHRKMTSREIPFVVFSCLILFFLVNDEILLSLPESILSRMDGFFLLIFFVLFFYLSFKKSGQEVEKVSSPKSTFVSLFQFFIGMMGLFFGGKWIVGGASEIAKNFGISEAFIGLAIVAIGTSLPELATSVLAAMKKKTDIAIGNVVGSNIFNVYFVLGLSSLINPIEYDANLNFDLFINFLVSLLLLIPLFSKERHLRKKHGVLFLSLYLIYLMVLLYRN